MAIAGGVVNAVRVKVRNGRFVEGGKDSCQKSEAEDDMVKAADRVMSGEEVYIELYGLNLSEVRRLVAERLGKGEIE